jgi:membrane protein implicated in regulation of membrane protease activity
VQIDDAMWLAVSADGTAIAAGNTVEVTQLVGTTLAVRPIPQHKNAIDS